MSSYQVDPDALFSDDEEAVSSPSPKRARITPAPRAPSLGPLKLPSYGTASLSGRPKPPPTNPSTSSFSSHSTHNSTNNSYSRIQNPYSRPNNPYNSISRPPFARGAFHHAPRYNRPNQPPRPYHAPPHPISDPPRGPMGRGRAATLPAHVTQRTSLPSSQNDSENLTATEKSINAMASILPEADRAQFIAQKLKEHQASVNRPSPVATSRKRPSRRLRPDDQSTQRMMANQNNARRSTFKGLESLLQAAQKPTKNLIQLEASRHRMHRPEKVHAVYAQATMTKEMIEREERERLRKQREEEEQLERIHFHFRDMRQRERDQRKMLAAKWRKVETVAAGMRHAYRLAQAERSLFAEQEYVKRRTLQYWGLTLLPVEEDDKVTELMTIHVEEI